MLGSSGEGEGDGRGNGRVFQGWEGVVQAQGVGSVG